MNYYYQVQAVQKYGLAETESQRQMYNLMSKVPPTKPEEPTGKTKSKISNYSQDQGLIDALFKRYPALKYVPLKFENYG